MLVYWLAHSRDISEAEPSARFPECRMETSQWWNHEFIFQSEDISVMRIIMCLFARVYWLAQSGDISVVESCTLNGRDHYSAALIQNSQPRDLEVFNGLLMMADPERGELVMHHVTSNVTRRLWSGTLYGVCVFSADVQNPGWYFLSGWLVS